jgi:hypothetical protein
MLKFTCKKCGYFFHMTVRVAYTVCPKCLGDKFKVTTASIISNDDFEKTNHVLKNK